MNMIGPLFVKYTLALDILYGYFQVLVFTMKQKHYK